MVFMDIRDINEIFTYQLFMKMHNFSRAEIDWINNFIDKHPDVLDKISNDITQITKDGKIDCYDIPVIIKIISHVFHDKKIKNELFNKNNVFLFIRFTFDSLLESKFLFLPDDEKEIIEKMIDTSIVLLQYDFKDFEDVEVIIEDQCCINWFFNFIGWKKT